ncbi:MAG: TetR/AcrR family transcriptional regulator [Leptospiraceae bacterium]|nr:TetR/AcrR family transcriptional regulator [Leptospiraceae bacterium]
MKKKDQTKEYILKTALKLFQKKGFEKTTMRDIAEKADLALGAAYYYFGSKEEIVLEFYERTQIRIHDEIQGNWKPKEEFSELLQDYFLLQIKSLEEYKGLLHVIANQFGSKNNSLSPFGKDTGRIRERTLDIHKAILIRTKCLKDKSKLDSVAFLLWLILMSLILFWIYDNSKNSSRTKQLIRIYSALLENLAKSEKIPLLKKFTNPIFEITELFQGLT